MKTSISIRKIFALTLFAAVAISSAALAQGGGGGGAAEREVVAPVAPAAERLEVPVALVERQAQLAEQHGGRPQCGNNDW